MNSRTPYPETDEDTDGGRVPRWAWIAGIVAALVLLIVVVIMLTGGGGHPRPDHGSDERDPSTASVTDQMPEGHTPPEGAH